MSSQHMDMPEHPCFSRAHGGDSSGTGYLRLPLAPGCNIGCRFCVGRGQGKNAKAAFSRILTSEGAVDRVSALIDAGAPPPGVELAGPGEPLVHAATFTVLSKLHWLYPAMKLSVWTNGLLLQERLEELVRSGLSALTISINAAVPETAERIYEWIIYRGRRMAGREAAVLLLHQQWSGLANAIEAGLAVTVSIAVLPGVNEKDIPRIEKQARGLGAKTVRNAAFSG